jgi:magnesium-transporting ATPase (P-type)
VDRADHGMTRPASLARPDSSPAHALAIDAVLARAGVDPATGLASEEAARRLAAGGPNELEGARPPSLLASLVDAATEPFVILLAVAGLLAVAFGEVRDGLLVLLGLIPIVGADVATAYRGERALEALRNAAAPRAPCPTRRRRSRDSCSRPRRRRRRPHPRGRRRTGRHAADPLRRSHARLERADR